MILLFRRRDFGGAQMHPERQFQKNPAGEEEL
jgi:hypothetical protein